jgi:gliding motility-associated-like protein
VQGDAPFTFEWTSTLGMGIKEGANSISPIINLPGIYTLEVTNSDGCTDEAVVEIVEGELAIVDLSTIVFPNVFTPNGDALNPNWKPFLRSNPALDLLQVLDEYKLVVYNRWGAEVFNTNGTPKEFDANDLSDGTYFYHVEYATNCGNGDGGIKEGTIYVLTGK